MRRPTAVTVIGWAYVVIGVLMTFGGLLGMLNFFVLLRGEVPPVPENGPAGFQMMSVLFQYFWVAALVQLVAAAVTLAAGAGLLRLRPWARPVAEGMSWLALAYLVGFGGFWVWLTLGMLGDTAAGQGPPAIFLVVFAGMGVVMMLAFAIAPVLIIRALRSAAVRQAFLTAGV